MPSQPEYHPPSSYWKEIDVLDDRLFKMAHFKNEFAVWRLKVEQLDLVWVPEGDTSTHAELPLAQSYWRGTRKTSSDSKHTLI